MTKEFGTPVPPWDKEDEPPAPPHVPTTPFPAIMLGMILLFALGFFMPRMARSPTNLASVETLTIAVTIIAWCAGFLLVYRRATTGWIAGSFFLLLIAAVLGTGIGVTRAKREMQADTLAYASIKRQPDGSFGLPAGVEPGPMTRSALTSFNEIAAIAQRRDDGIAALGMDRLTDPEAVTRDPALLRNCDRFSRAKAIVDEAAARLLAVREKFWAVTMPETGLDDMQRLADQTRRDADRARAMVSQKAMAAIDHDRLDISGEMCRILATTRWQAVDGAYRFANRADMLRYESYRSQRADLEASEQQTMHASFQRFQDSQRGMIEDTPE